MLDDIGRKKPVRKAIDLVIATVTFLVFFYSTTVAISLLYELDSPVLKF